MKRSKFSLSNYKLLSCRMGELVPIGLTEVLPGDSIQQATSLLLRTAPLVTPVMHPTEVRIHHWYVPHRLTWDDWENFITGGSDGMDASAFPTIAMPTSTGFDVGSLADYLGVPPGVSNAQPVSALPFRAYQLIYNNFYRDQDLSPEAVVDTTDGADTTTSRELQNIAWEKDYFTLARPWAQKGPEISIPLAGRAPVTGIVGSGGNTYTGNAVGFEDSLGISPPGNNWSDLIGPANAGFKVQGDNASKQPNIWASLADSEDMATMNQFRLAAALQRYEEARARYGSNYVDYLAYLGIRSSDSRLQRPEYLGGGKQTIQFSEVLQTAPLDDENPVGALKGHGIGAMRSNRYRRFFEEHGYIITLMSVRPKTIYADGIPKTWNRRTKEDFFQKELQFIGQEEILNKELYAAHTNPDGVFGYGDRYDSYRRAESTIAGKFRTDLKDWHMARIFTADPALNDAFVKCFPTNRIFADQAAGSEELWIMANHSIQARRIVAHSGAESYIY